MDDLSDVKPHTNKHVKKGTKSGKVSGKIQSRRKSKTPTVACAAIGATTVVFTGPLCIKEYDGLGAFWTADELIANVRDTPQGEPFNRREVERLLSRFKEVHPSRTIPIIFIQEDSGSEALACMEILMGEDNSPHLIPLERPTVRRHRVVGKVPPGTPDSISV